eukprot:3169186-Rhodomonas_salina.1
MHGDKRTGGQGGEGNRRGWMEVTQAWKKGEESGLEWEGSCMDGALGGRGGREDMLVVGVEEGRDVGSNGRVCVWEGELKGSGCSQRGAESVSYTHLTLPTICSV